MIEVTQPWLEREFSNVIEFVNMLPNDISLQVVFKNGWGLQIHVAGKVESIDRIYYKLQPFNDKKYPVWSWMIKVEEYDRYSNPYIVSKRYTTDCKMNAVMVKKCINEISAGSLINPAPELSKKELLRKLHKNPRKFFFDIIVRQLKGKRLTNFQKEQLEKEEYANIIKSLTKKISSELSNRSEHFGKRTKNVVVVVKKRRVKRGEQTCDKSQSIG